MKQVMYGIEIADVNDFGGWVGYEPVREDVAKTLNHHMYLSFRTNIISISLPKVVNLSSMSRMILWKR